MVLSVVRGYSSVSFMITEGTDFKDDTDDILYTFLITEWTDFWDGTESFLITERTDIKDDTDDIL